MQVLKAMIFAYNMWETKVLVGGVRYKCPTFIHVESQPLLTSLQKYIQTLWELTKDNQPSRESGWDYQAINQRIKNMRELTKQINLQQK